MAERLLKEIMGKADFDMEEYDKAMAAAFDDEYYEVTHACSSMTTSRNYSTTESLLSLHAWESAETPPWLGMGKLRLLKHLDVPAPWWCEVRGACRARIQTLQNRTKMGMRMRMQMRRQRLRRSQR